MCCARLCLSLCALALKKKRIKTKVFDFDFDLTAHYMTWHNRIAHKKRMYKNWILGGGRNVVQLLITYLNNVIKVRNTRTTLLSKKNRQMIFPLHLWFDKEATESWGEKTDVRKEILLYNHKISACSCGTHSYLSRLVYCAFFQIWHTHIARFSQSFSFLAPPHPMWFDA